MKAHPPLSQLLVISFLVIFASGELEFYQDVEPEQPDSNVPLKQLERYLSSHPRPRFFRRDHPPPIHQHPYRDDINYRDVISYPDQQREILEALMENPRILELLEKNKAEREYSDIGYPRLLNKPYLNHNYPKLKIPYPDETVNENIYLENLPRYPVRLRLPERQNYEDSAETRLAKLQEKFLSMTVPRDENEEELVDTLPEFTYHFDEPTEEEFHNGFAAKPNDPRFYENIEHATRREETRIPTAVPDIVPKSDELAVEEEVKVIHPQIQQYNNNKENKKFSHVVEIMPEPQRRAEKEPIITFTSTKASNDAYFIAIVAGCSAAAMFALVLISLTWCRLQRGVKAAADIEYPAYGVTGPNKDVSPSGDQRLAHSAQMYHFQHQKQQIIAMEKSAASRDPGSVSEAESDEENEEGDYTVYECPGLAPAGEVEVKNPMFHDDPTPATPQNQRDDDSQPRH